MGEKIQKQWSCEAFERSQKTQRKSNRDESKVPWRGKQCTKGWSGCVEKGKLRLETNDDGIRGEV